MIVRRTLLLAAVSTLTLAGCATMANDGPADLAEGSASDGAAAQALSYPDTRRGDVVETQFGVAVADPYRWLENDVREDDEVARWVAAQNAVSEAYLADLPGRDAFKARMTELYDYERIGTPTRKGGKYFYSRNDGLQNQSVLYVRDSLNGEGRVLIDPNGWSADGATALAEWVPSEDGAKLIYSVQDGGTDWRTVRVLDVATGKPMADEVKWVKFSALDWAKDGSGFYYSRFPAPDDAGTFQSLNTDQSVYFHRLGTPQSADVKLFATPDRPELNNVAEVSDDGRWLITTSSSGTDDRYEINLIDLASEDRAPRLLIPGFENNWSYVGNRGTTFYFQTNKDAPLLKVVSLDVAQASPVAKTIIAEDRSGERGATLDGVSLVGGKLIAGYLVDAKTEMRVYNLDGSLARKIALPGIGSAGGFRGTFDDNETFFAFTSFARPTTVYRYDVASGAVTPWAQPKVAFDPEDYGVEQRFYASKDGTRIPMFVIAKKGVDRTGGSPTLLYGYGGFNISMTPAYSVTRMAWLDAGGVVAVANLRGGGEYGKAWHDAGRLANKQNVFDDFIAAGEYLKAQGVTGQDELAIEGRSNGGLLVGAVVNQRPDLFAAALPGVGVMDMLRFDKFTAGRYWVDDYGYPGKEADFGTLYGYSPYHNIAGGRDYPAILVTTADTDDRVVPGHSFKYIAALQAADTGDAPKLIRIETRAGHGSGKPTTKIIDEFADMYAFIGYHTGLTR